MKIKVIIEGERWKPPRGQTINKPDRNNLDTEMDRNMLAKVAGLFGHETNDVEKTKKSLAQLYNAILKRYPDYRRILSGRHEVGGKISGTKERRYEEEQERNLQDVLVDVISAASVIGGDRALYAMGKSGQDESARRMDALGKIVEKIVRKDLDYKKTLEQELPKTTQVPDKNKFPVPFE